MTNNSTQGAASLAVVSYDRTTRYNSTTGDISAPAITPSAGNLIAVFVVTYQGSISGVTDTQSNTYTAIASSSVTNNTTGQWFYTYASSSASDTITAVLPTGSFSSIEVFEISGVVSSSPVDVVGTQVGATAVSYSTTSANEILLIGGHDDWGAALS